MLTLIDIKNLAVIEGQTINFGPGLNVISGETGAGKSIILEALELILGGRGSSELLRAGAEKWEVQSAFDVSNLPVAVKEEFPDFIESDELIISRNQNAQGKTRIYINGHLAALHQLEALTARIVNICRQGQQIKLLDSAMHLDLIDSYAGLDKQLSGYKAGYLAYQELSHKVEKLRSSSQNREARFLELSEEIKELSSIKLRAGMRQALEDAVLKQSNSEKILATYQDFRKAMDEGVSPAVDGLKLILRDLQKLAPDLQATKSAELDDYLYNLDTEIKKYVSRVTIDEEKLAELRDELAEVARLERKYRLNDAGLVELLAKLKLELAELDADTGVPELEKQLANQKTLLLKQAQEISKLRKAAAIKLAKEVIKELSELNLNNSQFEGQFKLTELSPNGIDLMEFMISTNKGEPLKPLKKVASGGELSRIMLVLKKLLNENSGVNVLIFDEVDTGISGSVARAVGEKLKSLSKNSQVICITHLPQVASLADQHFLVEKNSDQRTVTSVRELNMSERVEELARMISGKKISDTARATALELLQNN